MILFCQRGAQPDRGDGYQGEGEQPRRLQRPPRQPLPIQPHQVHLAICILAKSTSFDVICGDEVVLKWNFKSNDVH